MSHPIRGWIYMLVPVIGLGLGVPDARAEKKVDWTPYLEQPGDRVKPRATPKATVATPAKAKAQPRAQVAAKQRPTAQAQSKPKPKAKAKPRR
jgi:hypothetical protein